MSNQNDASESRQRQMERMQKDRFICDVVGIKLTDAGEGLATAELTLTPMHLNGVGICQGGVLFSIADYALAAAFNYTEDSVLSLDVSISYSRSAKTGKIIARAHETSRTRSTALGDVVVTDEIGRSEDETAIKKLINCGVKIIASMHAASIDEAKRRLGKLIGLDGFNNIVRLENKQIREMIKLDA